MKFTKQQRFLCVLPLAAVMVFAMHDLAIAQEGGLGARSGRGSSAIPGSPGSGFGNSAIGGLDASTEGQMGLGPQPKFPNDIKTLDQVRQLGSSERPLLTLAIRGTGGSLAGGTQGILPGSGGVLPPGMGDTGGMGMGMDSMGMGPQAEPSPRQIALKRIEEAKAKLKTNEDRAKVEPLLKAALAEYFMADMIYRVRELDEIKAKVAESEAKLQKRLASQQESVELQLKIMLREAEGQGFFSEE